jgi:hypothetical protein
MARGVKRPKNEILENEANSGSFESPEVPK